MSGAIVALGLASLTSLTVFYNILKLPKQNITALKKLLQLEHGQPRIFGHRAGQDEAPENTVIAIQTAAKNGATGVEVDLEFSKDSVPVLFHDEDVDRVTDGSGAVSSFTYSALVKLNAAAHFNYTTTKDRKEDLPFEKIPTLVEAVTEAKKHNLVIDLDVKSNSAHTCKALKLLLQKFPDAAKFIFVTSFYPHIIYQVGKQCPEFFIGLIFRYNF